MAGSYIERVTMNGKTVAVIAGDEKVITDVQSALDPLMTAKDFSFVDEMN